ncbi:uncharacterized protein LOC133188009 [Saccostrea echinata]|uniref:uncharacterized protein LOC133188009 n=1 Tax=Saccostrea echinata TaxID=191078 RepID=UPI002A81B3C7|nr:uncharacterized protein LOC133188009 [Saccostrea echinata]
MESKTFFQCEECGDFFDSMTVFQNHACARARVDHQGPTAQEQCDAREPPKDEKGNNYGNSWTRNATLLLIDLYKKYKDQIQSGKIRKKGCVGKNNKPDEGYSFNSEQLAGRWKSLLRAYKNVKDHSKKSGSGKKTYKYENELNDILGNDPIINPTFTLSSDASSSAAEKRKLDESEHSDVETSSEQSSCSTSAPKKKLTKGGTERQRNEMMQVFKEYQKEEQKEERIRREKLQREKMGLMRELIDVMKESTKK